ncbi:hypothetical protein Dimus_024681 [Dionaea muscipula]
MNCSVLQLSCRNLRWNKLQDVLPLRLENSQLVEDNDFKRELNKKADPKVHDLDPELEHAREDTNQEENNSKGEQEPAAREIEETGTQQNEASGSGT